MAAAFDYARSKATAERLIKRFGKSGAIRRMETSGEPWNPDLVPADYDCTLVVTDYTLRERESSMIGAKDRRVLISTEGLTITPTNSDKLRLGGVDYEIVDIWPLEPGDTVVLWEAQCTF